MSDDLTEKLMALVSATPSIEELEARIAELEAAVNVMTDANDSLAEEVSRLEAERGAEVWWEAMLEGRDVRLVTYKMADGDLVNDEFGWVTDTDFFDDVDEPIDLVKEVWVRVSVEDYTHHPSVCYCSTCDPVKEDTDE